MAHVLDYERANLAATSEMMGPQIFCPQQLGKRFIR